MIIFESGNTNLQHCWCGPLSQGLQTQLGGSLWHGILEWHQQHYNKLSSSQLLCDLLNEIILKATYMHFLRSAILSKKEYYNNIPGTILL